MWCDTPYTWDFKKFDRTVEVKEMTPEQVMIELNKSNIHSVVISGGEPLLQQKQLIKLLLLLRERGYWVEIETNGTIVPDTTLVWLVNQFNCSPKLSNSGDSVTLRIKPAALKSLQATGKTNFKFVVSSDQDIVEILELVNEYQMTEVYLMPEGTTKEELERKQDAVKRLCAQYGFHFSQRIHITELGGGRLV